MVFPIKKCEATKKKNTLYLGVIEYLKTYNYFHSLGQSNYIYTTIYMYAKI